MIWFKLKMIQEHRGMPKMTRVNFKFANEKTDHASEAMRSYLV